jgi:hypothetical protein
VYAYGHPQLSQKGESMAAILAAGPGSALAGWCAAAVLGVTKRRVREIEVIVPGRRRAREGFRLRTCRNLDSRDIVVVDRIPVTTVARLLVDLTDDADAEDLSRVIHEAAYLGTFDLDATRAAMERANGRRRLAVLDEALRLHESGSAGSRSRLEKRFRRLIGGLPAPLQNVVVSGFEVDFYWPGLCVEIDGVGHRRPTARSTTGSATPRCALPGTSCCASGRRT